MKFLAVHTLLWCKKSVMLCWRKQIFQRHTLISQKIGENVQTLWVSCKPVQNSPPFLDVVPRVGPQGVHHVWELIPIPDEEDWDIVACQIPIALLCVEFDGKATYITQACRHESSQELSLYKTPQWLAIRTAKWAALPREWLLKTDYEVLAY